MDLTPKYTNHLARESSPYLLQHAHNPVNWFPWGGAALAKAQAENKLILVSVGYAACHWCHVMEHESFEDEAIAAIMNEHFVCVKVDREERPDIDQIYMAAVQIMTRSGGWPLNCFALPDGRPVYGGTYFPKQQWAQVLNALALGYHNDAAKFEEYANNLTEGIAALEHITQKNNAGNYTTQYLKSIVNPWSKNFDAQYGGQNYAPKFPMPSSLDFLLQYQFYAQDVNVADHLQLTLNRMAQGGIYDQVGGGFARYSVDEEWLVPHFEKMLYDNGQLISLYSNAYRAFKNPLYKRVVDECIAFAVRELQAPEGGFYASLDADSEGIEGKFYVWDKLEFEAVLTEDTELLTSYFGVSEQGNWEGHNVLVAPTNEAVFAKEHGLNYSQLELKLKTAKSKLLTARSNRIRPALDDKILTSWNALMLHGLVDAYLAFGDTEYLDKAERNATFITQNLLTKDGSLFRNYKNNTPGINAFLDDYANCIAAFVALYQATFNERHLVTAQELTNYTLAHFYDKASGMFFYTSDKDPQLIARKMELADNVIPASNSVMAHNLYKLGILTNTPDYLTNAAQMLHNMHKDLSNGGAHYSNWSALMLRFVHEPNELVITGPEALIYLHKLRSHYLPNTIIAGAIEQGNLPLLQGRLNRDTTQYYVCKKQSCQSPTNNINELLHQLGLPIT